LSIVDRLERITLVEMHDPLSATTVMLEKGFQHSEDSHDVASNSSPAFFAKKSAVGRPDPGLQLGARSLSAESAILQATAISAGERHAIAQPTQSKAATSAWHPTRQGDSPQPASCGPCHESTD
jgi:hypothetical protein